MSQTRRFWHGRRGWLLVFYWDIWHSSPGLSLEDVDDVDFSPENLMHELAWGFQLRSRLEPVILWLFFFWGAKILIGRGSRWHLGSGDVWYPYWRVICAPKDSLENQSVRNFFGQLQFPPGFWTIWKGNHLGFGASPISGHQTWKSMDRSPRGSLSGVTLIFLHPTALQDLYVPQAKGSSFMQSSFAPGDVKRSPMTSWTCRL